MRRTYWMTNDPFQNLATLEQWMGQMVRETVVEQIAESVSSATPGRKTFVPPVDVYEDGERLLMRIEIPGLNEEDFDITLEQNVLTIQGERRLPEGMAKERLR